MTRLDFTLYRGLTFAGYRLIALDSAGAAVAQDVGTTYLLQARSAAGKALSFALPTIRGTTATGEIIISEASAATTADLPLGSFAYDLIPIDTDSKPWPPILTGTIRVVDPVSVPD